MSFLAWPPLRNGCGLVLLHALLSLSATAAEPESFVRVQQGKLPIILSAPHGGQLDVPDVDVRQGKGLPRGGAGYVVSRDNGTEELALEIARTLEAKFGKAPYYVIARSHRKYLDPNRPPEISFEDEDARPVYEVYHNSLTAACREVQKEFGRGLLLDVHGQSSAKDTVFRGTQDGQTVTLLRQRFGEDAHAGESSLFAQLKAGGWKVHPDPLDGKERAGYRGGYIVQTYGSHQGYGIDAIQLEFGGDFRTGQNRHETASTLVEAIAAYAGDFLGVTPDPPAKMMEVAVYQGAGTSRSREALVKVLGGNRHLKVRDITAEEIRQGRLEGCDVLIHPGGSGSAQAKALGAEGRQAVREFVKQGGGFVGVCAGAYLATCDYDWSLDILDAKVVDRQHWARGYGTVDIGLSPPGRELFEAEDDRLSIYYHQGPLLAPAEDPEIDDFESLAKYETEIAKNGAPQGVMTGCTAIARGTYHQGRVLCFSPHPERTEGQEQMLVLGVLWTARREASTESDQRHEKQREAAVPR